MTGGFKKKSDRPLGPLLSGLPIYGASGKPLADSQGILLAMPSACTIRTVLPSAHPQIRVDHPFRDEAKVARRIENRSGTL